MPIDKTVVDTEGRPRKVSIQDLPPSDHPFWGGEDASVSRIPQDQIVPPKMNEHYLVWQGPWAVCTKCPYTHTIPIDPLKYDLVDGRPVLRKKS